MKPGNPIISMDTKKKEKIVNLFQEGELYAKETIETLDHDFPWLAEGVAIPPCGLYPAFGGHK